MIQLDAPLVLWLIAPVAAVTFLGARWARRARLRRAAVWSPALARTARAQGRWTPLGLALVAALGTLALAGPRWGSEMVAAETQSLDLVLAIDISRSMLAEDADPSRLERARREARRLVQDLAGDRLGLLAFSAGSYILSPLTVDGSALLLLLDALDSELVSTGGTALAPVLRQGGEVLTAGGGAGERVLVVFTDGEAHDSLRAVVAEARRLEEQNVRLVLVAEGGERPVTIPVRDGTGERIDVWRDDRGRPVATARRDDILEAAAGAGAGTVVSAGLADQAGAVRNLLRGFTRVATTRAETRRGVLRAWVPISVGATLLLLVGWRRRTASLIALIAALGVARTADAQTFGRDPADRAWRAGRLQRAAELYVRQVNSGVGGDTAWLNAGTAALAVGDTALARTALERAARSLDPEIRFRALFNLGWLSLELAEAQRPAAGKLLAEAERAYREALLLRPHHGDAKWNLELTVRRRRQHGGGGGEAPNPSGGGQPPSSPPPPRAPPRAAPLTLSEVQAQQILASIAQEELRTRIARMGRFGEASPPGGKDW